MCSKIKRQVKNMHNYQNIRDQELAIIRCNQGIKLAKADKTPHSKRAILLDEMLNMPFPIFFTNCESELQIFNEADLSTCNILSASDAYGITARNLFDKQTAEASIQNNLLTIKTNKSVLKDELYTRLDGYNFPTLTYRFPWYGDNNQLVGLFAFAIRLNTESGVSLAESMSLLAKTGLLSSPEKALPGLIMDNVYFTQCEKVIIPALLNGKTAREIGLMQGRSKRTIETHIDNMKIKTNSQTKSELTAKLGTYFFE